MPPVRVNNAIARAALVIALVAMPRSSAEATSPQADARQAYAVAISDAQRAIKAGNSAAAMAALYTAPVEYRAWEWRYLEAEADLSETTLVGHEGAVRALAVSPNGRWITSSSDDGTVRLWSFETGACLDTLIAPDAGALDISPQVPLLAIAGKDVRLLDLPSLAEHGRIHPGATPLSLCFAGPKLVASAVDGTLGFWTASTGALLATPSIDGSARPIRSVVSFGDPNVFACLLGSTVTIYDFANRQSLLELGGSSGAGASSRPTRFNAIASSPSGRWLAAAGADSLVHLWDSDLYQERFLGGHTAAVSSVALDVRGLRLASGSLDGTARAWDLQTMALLGVMRGHRGEVRAVAFHPNSQHLITGDSTGMIKIWDVLHHSADQIDPPAMPRALDWAANHLALACSDSTVRIYEIAPLHLVTTLRVGGDALVRFSRDGGRLFTADAVGLALGSGSRGGTSGRIRSWDASTGELVREFDAEGGRFLDLALSVDGRLLAGAGEDGAVRLWDTVSGRVERTISEDSSPASALAWSKDGGRIAIGRSSGRLEIRESSSGRELSSATPGNGALTELAFGPDGRILSAGSDGRLREWILEGASLREAGATGDSPAGFAMSPSGDCLYLAGAGAIRSVDPNGLLDTATLDFDGDAVLLGFDPAGEQLAIVRKDGTVRLLSAARGLPEAVDARD